mmetsp:Transcript_11106/g.21271  ORF Transcript_11106/g.21271 Transcript_11106/m.21271 type:complete len:148 (-) Transcript_11106:296-739(-)
MKEAIKWTAEHGPCPHGDPRLHTDLARFHDRRREYAEAHRHYVRGSRPGDHARCVMEWVRQGYPSERDLFVTRGVLEYLCVETMKNANIFFENCVKVIDNEGKGKDDADGEAQEEATRGPLINFCEFCTSLNLFSRILAAEIGPVQC